MNKPENFHNWDINLESSTLEKLKNTENLNQFINILLRDEIWNSFDKHKISFSQEDADFISSLLPWRQKWNYTLANKILEICSFIVYISKSSNLNSFQEAYKTIFNRYFHRKAKSNWYNNDLQFFVLWNQFLSERFCFLLEDEKWKNLSRKKIIPFFTKYFLKDKNIEISTLEKIENILNGKFEQANTQDSDKNEISTTLKTQGFDRTTLDKLNLHLNEKQMMEILMTDKIFQLSSLKNPFIVWENILNQLSDKLGIKKQQVNEMLQVSKYLNILFNKEDIGTFLYALNYAFSDLVYNKHLTNYFIEDLVQKFLNLLENSKLENIYFTQIKDLPYKLESWFAILENNAEFLKLKKIVKENFSQPNTNITNKRWEKKLPKIEKFVYEEKSPEVPTDEEINFLMESLKFDAMDKQYFLLEIKNQENLVYWRNQIAKKFSNIVNEKIKSSKSTKKSSDENLVYEDISSWDYENLIKIVEKVRVYLNYIISK